jgi:hypothetical protein
VTGSALFKAVVACARGGGARVKVAVLVEGEDGAGVPVAKDVAALAAVVSPVEVVEGAFADSVIANGGFCVGLLVLLLVMDGISPKGGGKHYLPVPASGSCCDVREIVEIPFSV